MLERFFARLFALAFRMVLFAAGLVVVAVVVCLAGLFLSLWMLRSAWAQLTGKPVKPWTMRFGPRSAWHSVNSFRARGRHAEPLEERLVSRRGAADVIDVHVKERLE